MSATRHQRVPIIALTTQSLPNSPIDKVTEVSCGANGDTVSCLPGGDRFCGSAHSNGVNYIGCPVPLCYPKSTSCRPGRALGSRWRSFSCPACVASLQLCPGSSGVWLRRAEKTVLGAGGRGVVSSATLRLSLLMLGGKEWFCNRSDITTALF